MLDSLKKMAVHLEFRFYQVVTWTPRYHMAQGFLQLLGVPRIPSMMGYPGGGPGSGEAFPELV